MRYWGIVCVWGRGGCQTMVTDQKVTCQIVLSFNLLPRSDGSDRRTHKPVHGPLFCSITSHQEPVDQWFCGTSCSRRGFLLVLMPNQVFSPPLHHSMILLFCLIITIFNISIVGNTGVQWFALSPHMQEGSGFEPASRPRPFCVEFSCSLRLFWKHKELCLPLTVQRHGAEVNWRLKLPCKPKCGCLSSYVSSVMDGVTCPAQRISSLDHTLMDEWTFLFIFFSGYLDATETSCKHKANILTAFKLSVKQFVVIGWLLFLCQ